jgi:hypothetical protein
MSDYDSAWKEGLDHYFPRFLAFFFADVFEAIDWSRDYETLDTELQKLAPEGDVGTRRVDKLIKVYRKDTADPVYLHIEAQAQPEAGFERRVYVYNYRAEDRYNQPVVSLVVLGDDNAGWRPTQYVADVWRCIKTFTFRSVKLLDWAERLGELEASDDPSALLVLAHLQAQATRQDHEARRTQKVRLLRALYDRKLDAEDIRQRLRFIDWLLNLPDELQALVTQEIAQLEQEKKMTLVTTLERVAMWMGEVEGLLKGIEAVLDVKFGAAGIELMPEVRKLPTPKALQAFLQALRTAQALDDVRPLLTAPQPAPPPAP